MEDFEPGTSRFQIQRPKPLGHAVSLEGRLSVLGVLLQYINLGYSPLLVALRDVCLDQSSTSKNYVMDNKKSFLHNNRKLSLQDLSAIIALSNKA